MQGNLQDGNGKAHGGIKGNLATTSGSRSIHLAILDIKNHGQVASETEQRREDAHGDGPDELGFDVAENIAFPPGIVVGVGPDEGVEEADEVGEGDPEDEGAGGDGLVAPVADEGDDEDEHCRDGQDDDRGSQAGHRGIGWIAHGC